MSTRMRVLLALFVSVWVLHNAAMAWAGRTPEPRTVFTERAPGGDYPEVRGFLFPGAERETPLRIGDHLRRIGRHDLRGEGQHGVAAALGDETMRTRAPIPIEIERSGVVSTVIEPLPDHLPSEDITNTAGELISGIVLVLLMLRVRPTVATRRLMLAMACTVIMYTVQFHGPPMLANYFWIVGGILVTMYVPLWLLAFLAIPEEAGRTGGIHRWWPWLFAASGPVIFSAVHGFPFPVPVSRTLTNVISAVFVALVGAIMALNYRRASALGRRQLRWIAVSVYVGVLMVLVTLPFSGTADANAPMWSRLVLLAAGQLVNVAIVISVVRYDLFDVDRLLGATVSYNLLAVVVVGGGLLFVPTVTNAMTTRLGVDPTFGRTGITVVLAIVLIAAERKLRPLVERMIFKERYALEQAMKDLPEKFATVGRADALWKLTADELVENLRPANCVVFVSAGAAFVPVVNRGDVLAPQLAAGSPAVEWVRSAPTARLVGASGVRRDYPVAQATFRELGTQVVLPVTRNGALEVFVCIGEKRSGDIYTQTDLTLLTAVARTLSMHMLRFDEAELLERAQAMQAKMRRYVPGAVADAIARGTDLETGEREVSVLFVDLRGYTAYADGRETSAIFSTVNHYTEIVSTIVNSCGGVVVEFNGDGMMAVFGAPRPLPAKEQAALEAARRLVHEVPLMARESPDAPAMTVGVGIATGLAFVGNIEAADRTIWSAIGNTTNLAARLQSMTREMGVSLLADSTTAGRAKDAADGLVEHRGVTIRGRKDYETVFALPLTAPATLPSHTVPA